MFGSKGLFSELRPLLSDKVACLVDGSQLKADAVRPTHLPCIVQPADGAKEQFAAESRAGNQFPGLLQLQEKILNRNYREIYENNKCFICGKNGMKCHHFSQLCKE